MPLFSYETIAEMSRAYKNVQDERDRAHRENAELTRQLSQEKPIRTLGACPLKEKELAELEVPAGYSVNGRPRNKIRKLVLDVPEGGTVKELYTSAIPSASKRELDGLIVPEGYLTYRQRAGED